MKNESETAVWRSRVAQSGKKLSAPSSEIRLSWRSLRPHEGHESTSMTSEDLTLISQISKKDRKEVLQGNRRLFAARSTLSRYPTFQRQYDLNEVLGSGGCSDVFIGQQKSLNREVAIKIGGLEGGKKTRRFRAEAILTAQLDHPNIVPVYDAGDCFLVMKRVRGSSLQALIENTWPNLDLPRFIDVLIQVSNAVAFAHEKGVIHRDLKPANVMVGEFGEVLLLDWGLSWCFGPIVNALGEQDPMSDVIAGTPACMPPEIARGEGIAKLTPKSDVYCLGAMLYMFLCCDMPFSEDDPYVSLQRAAKNDYRSLQDRAPDAPGGLVLQQQQAMHTDPELRPSAEAFREGLRQWLLRAGNEPEAIQARKDAHRLLKEAQKCGHKKWEHQFRCFVEAIANLDRAHSLSPTTLGLTEERRHALDQFIQAALRAGSYQLARILSQGVMIPFNPSETE